MSKKSLTSQHYTICHVALNTARKLNVVSSISKSHRMTDDDLCSVIDHVYHLLMEKRKTTSGMRSVTNEEDNTSRTEQNMIQVAQTIGVSWLLESMGVNVLAASGANADDGDDNNKNKKVSGVRPEWVAETIAELYEETKKDGTNRIDFMNALFRIMITIPPSLPPSSLEEEDSIIENEKILKSTCCRCLFALIIFSNKNAKYTQQFSIDMDGHYNGTSLIANFINQHKNDEFVQKMAPIVTRAIISSSLNQRSQFPPSVGRSSIRPSSSPSNFKRARANSSATSSHITKIIEDPDGRRLHSTEYHDNQWGAPSLETLAREFKEGKHFNFLNPCACVFNFLNFFLMSLKIFSLFSC